MKSNLFYSDHFDQMRTDFRNHKQFVLFLGAGVNMSHGNGLGWGSLLDELFEEALTFIGVENHIGNDINLKIKDIFLNKVHLTEPEDIAKLRLEVQGEFSYLIKASIIKQILGNNYIDSIRQYIYSRCNEQILLEAFDENCNINSAADKKYFTLYQISKLILLNPQVRAVVTYNFDNLLTTAIRIISENYSNYCTDDEKKLYENLQEKGLIRTPVDISNSPSRDVIHYDHFPVYHIHGYIPSPQEVIFDKSGEIVLSMEEFYDNFGDVFSWQTATQLHFLNNYSILFAGLSFLDMNMQRMIRMSRNEKDKNYFMFCYSQQASDKGIKEMVYQITRIKSTFYNIYGLLPIVESDFSILFEKLDRIIEDHYNHFRNVRNQ